MIRRRRARLSTRLYVVGVVQILLVALAAFAIGYVIQRLPSRRDVRQIATQLEEAARDPATLDAALRALKDDSILVTLYDETGTVVATNTKPHLHLPRWARRAVANEARKERGMPPGAPGAAPSPPPFEGPPPHEGRGPPPEPPAFRGPPPEPPAPPLGGLTPPPPPAAGGGPPHPPDSYFSIRIHGSDGAVVVRIAAPTPGVLPGLLTLIFGLGVVSAGTWLTSRWIARPLERLARTARALGRGDLTARARLERVDEIGEVGFAFDEMAERLQALLAAEKELLANVAHELRTPLARIRVALELAGEGDAEMARTSLGEIAVDLSELESLVNDILTTARLEAQGGQPARAGFALHLEEISPSAVAERAAERLREAHPDRPLELNVAPDLGVIEADPVLFRRVIDNLLQNAHKYSPDPAAPITLSVAQRGDQIAFEVKDNGIGISEEDLPRIFTAFFRGERSRSRGTGGVGLGLTLARRIVEAHGGTITATSQAGVGTTVTVTVPRPPPSAATARNTS